MIEWCNNNQGFISALLTILTLLLSGLAIYVSIRTARLPYIKKLKLNSSNKYFMAQTIYGSVHDAGSALCISAVNLGNRIINLAYLGIGFLENGKMKRIALINGDSKYEHKIDCGDVTDIDFNTKQLVALCETLKGQMLYAYAYDSEGQEYKKKIGIYEDILTQLKA